MEGVQGRERASERGEEGRAGVDAYGEDAGEADVEVVGDERVGVEGGIRGRVAADGAEGRGERDEGREASRERRAGAARDVHGDVHVRGEVAVDVGKGAHAPARGGVVRRVVDETRAFRVGRRIARRRAGHGGVVAVVTEKSIHPLGGGVAREGPRAAATARDAK